MEPIHLFEGCGKVEQGIPYLQYDMKITNATCLDCLKINMKNYPTNPWYKQRYLELINKDYNNSFEEILNE